MVLISVLQGILLLLPLLSQLIDLDLVVQLALLFGGELDSLQHCNRSARDLSSDVHFFSLLETTKTCISCIAHRRGRSLQAKCRDENNA